MKVDAREILFIKENAPHGFIAILAKKMNMKRSRVRSQLYLTKEDYPDDLIIQARHLLKETEGIEYTETIEA